MKNTSLMKPLRLFGILLITVILQFGQVKGQTGASCSSALSLTISPGQNTGWQTTSYDTLWYSFTAPQVNCYFTFNTTLAQKRSLKDVVYGLCGNFPNAYTLTRVNDSTYFLRFENLVVSGAYKLGLVFGLSGNCGSCSNSGSYKLEFTEAAAPTASCTPTCTNVPICEYICNPGFENTSSIPQHDSQLNLACNWLSANQATPDLFSTSSPSSVSTGFSAVSVPNNFVGCENAFAGNNYAGFWSMWPQSNSYNEAMYTKLKATLTAGHTYSVIYSLSLADSRQMNLGNVGCAFAQTYVPGNGFWNFGTMTSLEPIDTYSITRNGWTTLSHTYTANGNEDYLIIGAINNIGAAPNFPYTSVTGPAGCSGASFWADYYYIDEVHVIDVATFSLNVTPLCNGQASISVDPPGASTSYTWTSSPVTGSLSSVSGPSITVSPSVTTTYTVAANGNGTCGNALTTTINTNPLYATSDYSFYCTGSNPVNIYANGLTTTQNYTWTSSPPDPSLSTQTGSMITVSPTVTTTYTVYAQLPGCSEIYTSTITITNNSPTVTLIPNPQCVNQPITVNINGGSLNYLDYNNDGAPDTSPFSYSVTGTYTVYVEVVDYSNTCLTAGYYTVSVIGSGTAPSLTVTPPSTVCSGSTVTLTVAGANSYTWSTGSNSSSITVTPSVTTVYTVTGTGQCGLTSTVTTTITVAPTPTINVSPASSTVCAGTNVVLNANGSIGVSTYTWAPCSSNCNTTAKSYSVTANITVTVTGTSSLGCVASKTVGLYAVPKPTVTVNSLTICAGNSATLTANGAANYTWAPGGSTLNPIVVTPTATTVYTVTGKNNGCTVSSIANSTVTVIPQLPGSFSIFTSSASPVIANGTGTNVVNLSSSITNTTGLSFLWQPSGINTPTTAFNLTQPEVIELTVNNTACQTSITSSVCLNYVSSNCGNGYSTISSMTLTNPSSLANGTYFVTGTITINWSSSLALEYKTFLMGTGAKVEITPTSDVTFNSMKFYSCNGMWRGIEILTHPSNSASLRITGDQNVIEDAYMGLYCINPSGLNANPNISVVNLVNFNKNYIDVYLENTKDPSRSYTFVSSKTKMLCQSSNTSPGGNLKCSGYYTPTVKARSYAGLYAKNAGIIDANVSALTADYVQVKNKDYGHYFDNTNANVNNINFADALGVAGSYTMVNSPSATGVGIYSKNSGYLNVKPATTPTTGVTTTFDNLGYGIITNGTYTVDVQNTSVTSSAHSSTVDPISIYKYAWGYATGVAGFGLNGIVLVNSRDIGRIHNNTITDNYYPVSVNYTLAPSSGNITSVSQNTISTSISGGITEGVSFNSAISFTPVTNNMRIAVNTLSNVVTGVKVVSTTTGLRISNNTILMNHSYASKGIYLSGSVGVMADNNSITTTNTGTNGAVFNFNQQGILVENSPGCKIQCNTISKTGIGIEFRGSCSSSGDGFFNNTLQYPMRRGLFISNGGIIGTQGSSSGASANQWTGSWPAPATTEPNKTTVGGTIPGGSASNAINSQLWVHNTSSELPDDNYISSPSSAGDRYALNVNTFTTTAGNYTSCAPTLTAGLRMAQNGNSNTAERDADFVNYVNNVLTSSNADLSPQAKYMLKQYMFDELNSNPSNEQALKTFMNQQQYTSVNAYQDVDSLLASGDLNAANTKNAQAPLNNDITQTQNAYNALYIKGITGKSDMEALQALAELCPDQYGMAVYQARAWLQSITYVARDYKDSCYTTDLVGRKGYDEEGASGITAKEGVQVKLYPNPNNGNFMLAYDLKNEDEAELYLYDVAGKLVYNTSLEKMSYLKQVNTSYLHNGIYFVQIRQNKAVLWTDKLIIQK